MPMATLDANALRILEARYLRRDEAGTLVETPDALLDRVATAVAAAEERFDPAGRERWREAFLQTLSALEFLPNSPTLMNAGTGRGQLSACFVLPVADSLDKIFDALKQMVMIQQSGGGTGFSFSRLRPRGDPLRHTGGRSSGPVSFLQVFDAATEHVREGGKRRGANLAALRADHPDVLEFVRAKRQDGALSNFNLSVAAPDAFLDAVAGDRPWDLRHPRTGRVIRRLAAREVMDEVVDSAWRVGDPGLLFLDAIARGNPTPDLGQIETTNPCGEVPLLAYESCNLGSVNLGRMVGVRGGRPEMDWERFARTVRLAVRFLDDVIEVNRHPLPRLRRAALATRKIGLGVMGLAEALVRLGLPYASEAAVRFGEEVARALAREARAASEDLARERGAFPAFAVSVPAAREAPVRNATTTSIAPTGTLSLIAGTTPGIEPLFALAFRRTHVLEDQVLSEVLPLLLERAAAHGLDVGPVLRTGTLAAAPGWPPEVRRLFETAHEIEPEAHLAMQAAFQRHVDNAVSKTVNLPEAATRADVAKVYLRAFELGLKGVTVFRHNSKGQQVIEPGVPEEAPRVGCGPAAGGGCET